MINISGFINWNTGASSGFGYFFFRSGNLHVAKRHAAHGFGLYLEKLIYFYIKNNYDSNSFAMRLVIAPENFLKSCDIEAF